MYQIKAESDDVTIDGYTFTTTPVNLVSIPILRSVNYAKLFNKVFSNELVIIKNDVDLDNGLPVISHLITLSEGARSIHFNDDGLLFNQWTELNVNKEEVIITDTTLTLSQSDSNSEFDIRVNENFDVILPHLDDVSYLDIFEFKNLHNASITGSFYPISGEEIESQSVFEFHGKGLVRIRKKNNNTTGQDYWSLAEGSSLKDKNQEGRSKKVLFDEIGAVTVIHSLGYTPSVEVWVNDGAEFSEANVDIDHDLQNFNSFTVNLTGTNNGFILYN